MQCPRWQHSVFVAARARSGLFNIRPSNTARTLQDVFEVDAPWYCLDATARNSVTSNALRKIQPLPLSQMASIRTLLMQYKMALSWELREPFQNIFVFDTNAYLTSCAASKVAAVVMRLRNHPWGGGLFYGIQHTRMPCSSWRTAHIIMHGPLALALWMKNMAYLRVLPCTYLESLTRGGRRWYNMQTLWKGWNRILHGQISGRVQMPTHSLHLLVLLRY